MYFDWKLDFRNLTMVQSNNISGIMTQENCSCIEDSIEKCDIFDFMAKYVGLSVLHPGGFGSTKRLLAKLKINSSSRVLDIACGKGTTSILIAKKYQCHVTGIDISSELINASRPDLL